MYSIHLPGANRMLCSVHLEMMRGSNLKVLIENGAALVLKRDPQFLMKRGMLLLGVESGLILPRNFAQKLYRDDQAFFRAVLRRSSKPFAQFFVVLPASMRRVPLIGLTILKESEFDENSLAFHLRDIPAAVARIHIFRLMQLGRDGAVSVETRGGEIWDKKDAVIALCRFKGWYFVYALARLKGDPDVARAAFSNGSVSSATICSAPSTLFEIHYDIAALAIKVCSSGQKHQWHERENLFEHLGGQSIATRRVVLLAWLQRGWCTCGHFLNSIRFGDDVELALEAIKHREDEYFDEVFCRFDKGLKGNKSFMVDAVKARPAAIKYASKDLMHDFDFMLRTISLGRDVLMYFDHKKEDFDRLADFAHEVRAKLAVTDCFILEFLGAIAINPPESKRGKCRRTSAKCCQLRKLDLGHETGVSFKKSIAE